MIGWQILPRIKSYVSVYYILQKHHLLWAPRFSLLALVLVCALAVLYPLPFAMFALIPAALSSADSRVSLPLGASLPLESAVAIALAGFVLVACANCLVDRWVYRRNMVWQDALFWQIAEGLPRFARVDRVVPGPLPLRQGTVLRLVFQAIRSACVIGRLITAGVKDLVIVLVTLTALAVMDVSSLAVIVGVSILFAPFYVLAATEMVRLRLAAQKAIREGRQEVVELLERAGDASWRPRELHDQAGGRPADHFSLQYSLPNRQYAILALLNVIAMVHASALLASVFLWSRHSSTEPLADRAVYFMFFLLFLRSLLGIASLLSNFTRSYTQMSWLSTLIDPRLKPIAKGDRARTAPFVVRSKSGQTIEVSPVAPTYLLMPTPQSLFDLIVLSNELQPTSALSAKDRTWLGFVDHHALERISAEPGAATDRSAAGPGAGPGAFVFTAKAWARGRSLEAVRSMTAGRPVLVAITPGERPADLGTGAQLIVSDGRSILAVGEAGPLLDAYAERIGALKDERRASSLADEDDEDL